MATINREFLMDLLQPASFIEYFLPKSKGIFGGIHFFAVVRAPTTATGNPATVNTTTSRVGYPISEFPLVV
jgi:hypothetical protein